MMWKIACVWQELKFQRTINTLQNTDIIPDELLNG